MQVFDYSHQLLPCLSNRKKKSALLRSDDITLYIHVKAYIYRVNGESIFTQRGVKDFFLHGNFYLRQHIIPDSVS